ncbi:DNA (cytosine-5-)-methyltransferase [Sporosarcina sp. P26b]|uniref:DNA cytosine methyltransferase n=1 Tax=Sporosarcina sp. P26b TaxID=2048253 RepID=UPI000C16C5AE|nr:DNA cytosine methyltransferase [Sporosarcina sp. P26b]PIC95787.1 DNA (cytosine-5-)-methyltransferase [Sporosarcina sp. P26b]
MKVVSLFAGCGGSDVGIKGGFEFIGKKYKKLPFEIVYANDIDRKALNSYEQNFGGNNIVCEDIRNISTEDIPNHNLLVGGFPCQSFSTVNPTKDPFDERANLYKEMIRVLKDKQPDFFIAENVRGFMTLKKGVIFQRVCDEFNKCGYNLTVKLINSADYGIPQKRYRVFIVGVRKDYGKNYIFPEPTHTESSTSDDVKWVPLNKVIKSLVPDDPKYYFSERAVQGMKNAKKNMKRGLWQDLNGPCLTITSHLAKVSLNSRDPVLLVDPEKELYRRFTPREAARIQSFPDNFEFVGSEADAYRQIGNAIPPVVMWYLADALLKQFENVTITNSSAIQSNIINGKHSLVL